MDVLMAYKRQALEEKQSLADLMDFWASFQRYIEVLAPVVAGKSGVPPDLERSRLALERLFRDMEHVFEEWHDGEPMLTPSVARLIEEPGAYLRPLRPDWFYGDLQDATVKFEHLIKTAERDLRKLHEKIALEAGEEAAVTTTELEPLRTTATTSIGDKVKSADEVGEIGIKWGKRVTTFLPWAYRLAEAMGWVPPIPK